MTVYKSVPKTDLGLIGGSATLGCRFPEDAGLPWVTVEERDMVFDTPYGQTTKWKYCTISGDVTVDGKPNTFLSCRMHGWSRDQQRRIGNEQVFWVLQQAGVRNIISDAGVGAVNPLFNTRDFVVPDDFLDLTTQRPTLFAPGYLIIMREPICPDLKGLLDAAARQGPWPRVIDQAVQAVTEGPRWESVAEIRHIRRMGADLVAQSLVPEVHLARQIGACYAQANVIVNHAEGVVQQWEHAELKAIFVDLAVEMSKTILEACRGLTRKPKCRCMEFRKPSILKWDEADLPPRGETDVD
jgi:5'-methylthioadenosine phosphorylase